MGPFTQESRKIGPFIYFLLKKGGQSYTWQRWKRGLFGTHIRTLPYIGSYPPSPPPPPPPPPRVSLINDVFVCHYRQWPILINCVMCYYLCVLRWLMRPILALNCLLQIEQERSEEESSVGDALALAFRCARFCSASLILFASYSPAPLFMRPRHFVRSCAICSHDSVGMLKSLREALRVSLYRFFWSPWERFPTLSSP